jgi:hypothetical protein
MNTEVQDINTFREGTVVDIPGTNYQHVKIDRINDCGVYISGSGIASNFVISGRSPAIESKLVVDKEEGDSNKSITPSVLLPFNPNYIEPQWDFTIAQFAEENCINVAVANKYVQQHYQNIGFAKRSEGQRGKSAKLFRKKA